MGLVEMKGGSYTAAVDGIRARHISNTIARERKIYYSINLAGSSGKNVLRMPLAPQDLAAVVVLRDEKSHLRHNRPSLSRWTLGVLSTACVASAGFLVASVFSFVLEISSGDARMVLPSFTAIILFGLLTLSTFRLNSSVQEVTKDKLK